MYIKRKRDNKKLCKFPAVFDIKNLPGNISERINTLSADETTFIKSEDLYNNALAESGFKHNIKF